MEQIRFTKRFKSSWQTSWGGDHRLLYSTSGKKNHSWMKQQRHKLPTNTETRTASELKLSVKQVSVPRLSITYKNFNIISIPSWKKIINEKPLYTFQNTKLDDATTILKMVCDLLLRAFMLVFPKCRLTTILNPQVNSTLKNVFKKKKRREIQTWKD